MENQERQYIHFSFDDVWICLKDITEHAGQYRSVFENKIFGWMKRMHDTYGAVFSLYTFNYFSGDSEYDISALPNCYAAELKESAAWLKFGFHAKDDPKKYAEDEQESIKEDYNKFCSAILYATNHHVECIDRVVRLGWFAGTRRNIFALRDQMLGIKGLLSADDDRLPYYFDKDITIMIQNRGELQLDKLLVLRSQPRIEGLCSIEALVDKMRSYTEPKVIELFSHEYCFEQISMVPGFTMQALYELFIKWAYENGYGFGFAQDLYEGMNEKD